MHVDICNPKRYQFKILFCGRGLKVFSLLRGTGSKATYKLIPPLFLKAIKEDCFSYLLPVKLIFKYLLTYFFRLSTLKGPAKAPTMERLRLNRTGPPVLYMWDSSRDMQRIIAALAIHDDRDCEHSKFRLPWTCSAKDNQVDNKSSNVDLNVLNLMLISLMTVNQDK